MRVLDFIVLPYALSGFGVGFVVGGLRLPLVVIEPVLSRTRPLTTYNAPHQRVAVSHHGFQRDGQPVIDAMTLPITTSMKTGPNRQTVRSGVLPRTNRKIRSLRSQKSSTCSGVVTIPYSMTYSGTLIAVVYFARESAPATNTPPAACSRSSRLDIGDEGCFPNVAS
jgi:hypothetical protein